MTEQLPPELVYPETHAAVTEQVIRLKRQWGYGRWSREEAEQMALAEADEAVEIQFRHPPELVPSIPRRMHRVWIGEKRPDFEAYWAEAMRLHPGWVFFDWSSPADAPPFWESDGREVRNVAQMADLMRLEALREYGGVYIDADIRLVRSLEPLLIAPGGAFAAWEDPKTVCNAVIGAAPRHPAISALLEYTLTKIPGPTWWAGPGAATAMLQRPDVTLLDPMSFYPVHYKEKEGAAMQASAVALPPDETFGVHMYAGSWR